MWGHFVMIPQKERVSIEEIERKSFYFCGGHFVMIELEKSSDLVI